MMFKSFQRWVLGLVLCSAVQVGAQSLNNPGFMGRTQSVSTGTQLSAGIYKGFQSQALWVASYEKTLRRDLLVQLRYTAGMLNVAFPKHNLMVDGPGAGSAVSYDGQLDFGNPPSLFTRSFGVQMKRYLLNRGALAPFGMYLSYGGEVRKVSATDSFNQMVLVSIDYNNPERSTRFDMPAVMPRPVQSFNVLVGIGNKRFFKNNWFLDYQFGMTWMMSSNATMFSDFDQNRGPSYNSQNAAELRMRMADTRRQLFTLNITSGMVF
jgi:hypothetical protein